MNQPRCLCNPLTNRDNPFDEFIGYWFSQCVYSTSDYIGFVLGLLNLAVWLTIHAPQIAASAKSKGQGLSPVMLSLWLSGDVLGVLGLLLTGQGGILMLTQIYYLTMDSILFVQFLYFKYYANSITTGHTTSDDGSIEDRTDLSHLTAVNDNYYPSKSSQGGTQVEFNGSINSDNNNDFNHSSSFSNYPLDKIKLNNISECEMGDYKQDNCDDIDTTQGKTLFTLPSPPSNLVTTPNSFAHTSTNNLSTTPSTSSVRMLTPSNVVLLSTCIIAMMLTTPTDAAVNSRVLSSIHQITKPINNIGSIILTTLQEASEAAVIPLCTGGSMAKWQEILGIICAFLTFFIYAPSRIPQVLLNHARKSTHGLSKPFIFLAIVAAFFYGGSILIPSYTYDKSNGFTSSKWWLQTGPYLGSTVVAFSLNIFIVFQMWIYREKTRTDALNETIPNETNDLQQHEDDDVSETASIVPNTPNKDADFLLFGHSMSNLNPVTNSNSSLSMH